MTSIYETLDNALVYNCAQTSAMWEDQRALQCTAGLKSKSVSAACVRFSLLPHVIQPRQRIKIIKLHKMRLRSFMKNKLNNPYIIHFLLEFYVSNCQCMLCYVCLFHLLAAGRTDYCLDQLRPRQDPFDITCPGLGWTSQPWKPTRTVRKDWLSTISEYHEIKSHSV